MPRGRWRSPRRRRCASRRPRNAGDVVGVGELGRAVDRDVVVVVYVDEPAQSQVTCERRGLVADPFFEVSVGADHEGVVVHEVGPETGTQDALGNAETDAVSHTLAERSRGHLHSTCQVDLRMPRGPTAPLAELLNVLDFESVAGEKEHRVVQDRSMSGGEHEAVAVGPVGVAWVVTHDAGEKDMSQRGEGHRGAGVARVSLLGRVHGDASDDVDTELFELLFLHDATVPAVLGRPTLS